VCLALAIGAQSCGKSASMLALGPNLLPILTILGSTIDTSLTHPTTWSATVEWLATDPDGTVLRSEYAIDPGASETTWVQTQTPHAAFDFAVKHREPNGSITPEFHVFVVRAVDNRNEFSPVASRAFYAATIAPSVQIAQPAPGLLTALTVPQSFTVSWVGDDPDGYPTHRPDHYEVRTILPGDPLYNAVWSTPDSLVRQGERTGWEGWTRYGGDTTSCTLGDLPLSALGAFAVIAFDTQGAHTPQLAFDRNLLQFRVSNVAPKLHTSSPFFDFTFQGGLQTDPSVMFPVELPAGVPLFFNLEATPVAGSHIQYLRWVLDPVAGLTDTTTRTDPTDVHRWSLPLQNPAVVTIGPFFDAAEHRFWVEIVDNLGRKSLCGIRFTIVRSDFQRELLIVDDTRMEPDKFLFGSGCPAVYTKPWPSAAELDTFLYARGGVPWRCTRTGGAETSVPGLFAAYGFDTLGTRRGFEDPTQAVLLSTLGRYRHVVWLVDQQSALNAPGRDGSLFPLTALRAMASPGHRDPLYAYGRLGGQIWLAGGGTALASLVSFDVANNNSSQGVVFDSQRDELRTGQLPYDLGHLRSAIAVSHAGGLRYLKSPAARGGWSGQGEHGTLAAPDYSRMPGELRVRTPDSDAIPPTRTANQAGLYYPSSTDAEYVSAPNGITEDLDPDSTVVRVESTLDTLYDVSGNNLVLSPAPVMTYYHGLENAPFIFSGFDLWSWTRGDAQALVDFVLHDVWGLQPTGPGAAFRSTSGVAGARQTKTAAARSRRLDPPRARP
jgi:hypothetical protein